MLVSRVPYKALTHVFAKIEATTKRIEITSLLMSFLLLVIKRSKSDDSDSLRQAVYLCINRVIIPVVRVHLHYISLSFSYAPITKALSLVLVNPSFKRLLHKALAESQRPSKPTLRRSEI